MAENKAGQFWSDVLTFSTGDFEFDQVQLPMEICFYVGFFGH